MGLDILDFEFSGLVEIGLRFLVSNPSDPFSGAISGKICHKIEASGGRCNVELYFICQVY